MSKQKDQTTEVELELEKRLVALEAFVWSPQAERLPLEALAQLLLEVKELRQAIPEGGDA